MKNAFIYCRCDALDTFSAAALIAYRMLRRILVTVPVVVPHLFKMKFRSNATRLPTTPFHFDAKSDDVF
jgi:hypothetical protein